MSAIGEIFGGLLGGAGTAMVDQAKAERESALKQLEMETEERLREKGLGVAHGYNMSEEDNRAGHTLQNTRTQYELQGKNQADSDQRQDNYRLGELGVEHTNRMGEIGATGAQQRQSDQFKSDLDDSSTDRIIGNPEDGGQIRIDKKGRASVIRYADGTPVKMQTEKVPASVTTAIIKAHTSVDEMGKATVDMDGAMADLEKARVGGAAGRKPAASGGGDGGGGQGGGQGGGGAPVQVKNDADYARLKSGARYIDPNGNVRTKK